MDHQNGTTTLGDGHASSETFEPIAIVGLSCRLPGTATNPQKLWELLENGGSAWSQFPKERFNDAGFRSTDPANHKAGTVS